MSMVLPSQFTLGYSGIGQMVVKTYNGMNIHSIEDILKAQTLNPDSLFDVVEFEMDSPTVVIARNQIAPANRFVGTSYGVRKLLNINP